MGHTHLSEDELIDRLYGLSSGAGFEGCRECETRWRRLGERRMQILEVPEVAAPLLSAGRRKTLERIEAGATQTWRRILAPAAVVAMIAFSVGLQIPAPRPEPTVAQAVNDQTLFEQVFRDVTRTEPQSLAAVRNLFEGQR